MIKFLEKKIEQDFCIGVRPYGKAIKLQGLSYTGFPDRTAMMPGGVICFVEFKRPGEEPTPRQKRVMAELTKLGFECFVIDDFRDAAILAGALRAFSWDRQERPEYRKGFTIAEAYEAEQERQGRRSNAI